MKGCAILLAGLASISAMHARTASPRRPAGPETQLKQNCSRCHKLNVVRAQHLSREEWQAELDKMTSMGAKIADRQALLDYLAKKYGATVGDPGERVK